MFSTRAKKVPISHWRHFQAGGKWGKIHPKAVRPPARPFAFDKEIIIFAPNWEKERIRRSPPLAATSPAVQRGNPLSAPKIYPRNRDMGRNGGWVWRSRELGCGTGRPWQPEEEEEEEGQSGRMDRDKGGGKGRSLLLPASISWRGREGEISFFSWALFLGVECGQ